MKKNLLLLFLALVPCYLLQAQSFFLDSYYSDDGFDRVQYYYNNDNLLESYHVVSGVPGDNEQFIDSLYYDERGNVIRVNSYQYYNDQWIFPCYIEYTYDDKNNRTSRTNYNDFGSGHEIQGVYTYFYEDDVLTRYEMTLGGSLLMRGTYTYNAQGLLDELVEEMYSSWMYTWENSSKTKHTYDANGNETQTAYYYWDYSWVPESVVNRTFDENNNCMIREQIYNGTVADRVSYVYDYDYSINDCLMPYHPEPSYTWDDFRGNKPLGFGWETADDGGTLVYICDYIFEYGELDDAVSANYARPEMAVIFPNPTDGELNISLDGLKRVEILDVNGKLVMQSDANGKMLKMNVSELASGLYFVKSYNGQTWTMNKIQVK